jgi:hypothetical protein
LVGLGFELRASNLQSSHSAVTPPVRFALQDGVLPTICPGWPRTTFLPISASQVARIIGVSHQSLTSLLTVT